MRTCHDVAFLLGSRKEIIISDNFCLLPARGNSPSAKVQAYADTHSFGLLSISTLVFLTILNISISHHFGWIPIKKCNRTQ